MPVVLLVTDTDGYHGSDPVSVGRFNLCRPGDGALLEIAPYTTSALSRIHERTFAPGQVVILDCHHCGTGRTLPGGVLCRPGCGADPQVITRRLGGSTLAYLGPGEPFNLIPALDGGSNLATVEVVTDTTLYTIPCEHFRRIMRDHHEVSLPRRCHGATGG